MNLLYALESVRTPFWDAVFSAVTHLGEETVFMVAAILIFWCVSKQEGYYLLLMGFFGTVVNQFLKLLFRIPRPWVRDPDFTIVESARAQATGYSFPSGHTQNAVATFGGIARSTRRPWVRWACVAVLLLVSFSRLYLGVHTPLDVGVSFAVAGVMVLTLYPLIRQADRKPSLMAGLIAGMLLWASRIWCLRMSIPSRRTWTRPTWPTGRKTAGSCWGPPWASASPGGWTGGISTLTPGPSGGCSC